MPCMHLLKLFSFSIAHDMKDGTSSCATATVQGIPGKKLEKELKIAYTYDLTFKVG